MNQKIFLTASCLGMLGVILGAFATHGLKPLLSDVFFDSFQVAIRYQMYHAFFLFVVGLIPQLQPQQKKYIFWFTLSGILLFSGSIYLLATNSITPIDFSFLGPITPLGGLLLISAWGLLGFYLLKTSFS